MTRQHLNPPTLNRPAVYSQAVKVGNVVFAAGQCASALDGSAVGKGDAYAQGIQCYQNLRAALEAAGASMRDVVKVTTFSTLEAYQRVLFELRPQFFEPPYPASTDVVITSLADPAKLFEVEAIAIVD